MDEKKAQQFGGFLAGVLNNASLALNISLGHRLGLFDAMSQMKPSSSEEIAKSIGFNERYVREWLNALVVSKVISYEPQQRQYHLPPEHAKFLTKYEYKQQHADGVQQQQQQQQRQELQQEQQEQHHHHNPNNHTVIFQFVPVLAQVEDEIIKCFKQGGGVSYDHYHHFHRVMMELSTQTVIDHLHEHIIPLVPGLSEQLVRGIDVADFGCGRGRVLIKLAQDFPNSRFVGYDLLDETVDFAKKEKAAKHINNVQFIRKDCSRIEESDHERFDMIFSFDAIHDQGNPPLALRGIYQSLKPGGTYLMQDIRGSSFVEKNLEHPIAPTLYTISLFHCMTVSLSQHDGMGMGTLWGEEKMKELLQGAGFSKHAFHSLPSDPINVYVVAHKPTDGAQARVSRSDD